MKTLNDSTPSEIKNTEYVIRNTEYASRITHHASRLILFLFILLSTLYAIVVPPFEASDELWHYPMVKYIADNWALPVQDPQNVGPWRQEGNQPPLYYFIGAVATFWIDTSDVDVVRHVNPHADGGVVTPDGNVNLVTHNPQAEAFPWRGTTLAVRIIRFLSVLMGATTVYLTYRLVLELFPTRPNLALAAAAVNAFTPMFLFISGAVNNDNLVIPLCSLALLQMVRLIKSANLDTQYAIRNTDHVLASPLALHASARGARRGTRITHHVFLGLIVALALLTKESAGGLVLLTALTVTYVAWQAGRRDGAKAGWQTFLIGGLATALPVLLVAGWWYLRNWQLYGDPLGQNVFIEILGQRDVPADLAQLWRERISFIRGYWGNFGGLNVPLPDPIYAAFDVLLLLAAVGLIILILRQLYQYTNQRRVSSLRRETNQPTNQFALLLTLLWPLLVVVLWITWATTTWSSQGRLVFSAISVWSLLLVLGWDALARLLPRRWQSLGLWLAPLFMFSISLAAPLAWIQPAYAQPPALAEEEVALLLPAGSDSSAPRQRIDAVFFHPAGGQLKLLGYETPVLAAYPGQPVPVTLYWEAIEPFNQDYSTFVHLVDSHDLVVAQRDAFPGMGTLSTQWLAPGRRWAEKRVLTLPDTAFSPNRAVFEVGLYDYRSQERLTVVDAEGQMAGDNVRFGRFEVLSLPAEWPNPIEVDFGGQLTLVGYDLNRRALSAGQSATLTLYWRAQRSMAIDYSISTQFVNRGGVKAAQKDAWPFDGALPTSLWEPGQIVEEARELTIFEGTSPGVYDVYVAVYPSGAPGARLVVTPAGGRLQTDHVVLTTVRVLP
jgi:hypothetical protein